MTKTTLALSLFALFGIAASANAQIANPDNDSATFFSYKAATAATPANVQTKVGDVSANGLYVYVNPERGWTQRGHDYVFAGGVLAHTSDCLPYDLPKPVAGGIAVNTTGAFADHGA